MQLYRGSNACCGQMTATLQRGIRRHASKDHGAHQQGYAKPDAGRHVAARYKMIAWIVRHRHGQPPSLDTQTGIAQIEFSPAGCRRA